MPRKVKRGCTGSPRRSRRGHGRKSLEVKARKRVYGCSGSRKRRQSRKPMRGGFNEQALQEVLDAALSSTSGGALSGARLNGGQGGGSRRRRTKRGGASLAPPPKNFMNNVAKEQSTIGKDPTGAGDDIFNGFKGFNFSGEDKGESEGGTTAAE